MFSVLNDIMIRLENVNTRFDRVVLCYIHTEHVLYIKFISTSSVVCIYDEHPLLCCSHTEYVFCCIQRECINCVHIKRVPLHNECVQLTSN